MTLTDILSQLKNSASRLQDCDVEIDNEDLEVTEFSYSNSWGVSVSINSAVEVEYLNGVAARKWLVIEEETFDEIIDKLEEINSPDNTKMNYFLNEIQDRVTDIRILLGETHADHSER